MAGLTDDERAKVARALERYVTATRFPISLSEGEACDFLGARVEEMIQRFRESRELQERERREALSKAEAERLEATTRAQAEQRRRAERKAEFADVQRLINEGNRWATIKTMRWSPAEREDARQAVREELEECVDVTWSERQVHDRVEGVLADTRARGADEDGEDGDEEDDESDVDDDGFDDDDEWHDEDLDEDDGEEDDL
jgi:hypothetical protein